MNRFSLEHLGEKPITKTEDLSLFIKQPTIHSSEAHRLVPAMVLTRVCRCEFIPFVLRSICIVTFFSPRIFQ